MKNNLKIAVIHDHLEWSGGGERTALTIAIGLKSDFITAYASPGTFANYQNKLGAKLKILTTNVIKKEVIRFFWLRCLFWRNRKVIKQYDIIIGSGQAAVEAITKYAQKKAVKILYNHTPPRRIYDLYRQSRGNYKFYLRPFFSLFTYYWRKTYIKAVGKIDVHITNSQNTRERLKKYTGYDTNYVVWPPIHTDKFQWKNQKYYFLSWGRLDENKRIDLIVRAFQKLPDEELIIASGGKYLNKITKLAKGFNNIKVLGSVSDERLNELVGSCRAAIYIPHNEDAGMTHLEANAAGKPVILAKEGGLIESSLSDKTCVFIKADPRVEDIIWAVKKMTPKWCVERKDCCIQHAKNYSKNIFGKKIKDIVQRNNPNKPILGIDASRWQDPRHPDKTVRTGVEVYTMNLIKEIVNVLDHNNIILRLYTSYLIKELPLEYQKIIPGKKFWTLRKLNRELSASPPDYFFTPAYYIPRSAPKKSYATIHDVIFRSNPGLYDFSGRHFLNLTTKLNIKRSRKIITISNFSKKEIMREYGVKENKIVVAPMGHASKQNINKDGQREKTILYIGRIEKKKSVHVLIEAFADFYKNNNDWRLVLTGSPGFKYNEIENLISSLGLKKSIRLSGYLSDGEKWNILAKASMLVHPSANEGSCLPLFEAWDAKIPAILADVPVLRELGGSGSLYFKPGDKTDLSQKINHLTADKSLCSRLVNTGSDKLKKISWENTAKKTLDIILG